LKVCGWGDIMEGSIAHLLVLMPTLDIFLISFQSASRYITFVTDIPVPILLRLENDFMRPSHQMFCFI